MSTYLSLLVLHWHIVAAVLGVVIGLFSLGPYIYDIYRGETRPNALTFVLWTILEIIAFVAQAKSDKPSWSLVIVGLTIFNTALIGYFALTGHGYIESGILKAIRVLRRTGRRYHINPAEKLSLVIPAVKKFGLFEAGCLGSCVAAVILWQISKNGNVAIAFSIVADIFACLPTLRKVRVDPRSESVSGWILISIAMFFGAAATEVYDFPNLAFPGYTALMTVFILARLVYYRWRERRDKQR